MGTLSSYNGATKLISGLTQNNPANKFPIVEAHDVLVADGDVRLDSFLGTDNASTGGKSVVERIGDLESKATNVKKSDTNGNIKVDNAEVNVYTHPETHAATMIVEDATHRFVSDTEKTTWNAKVGSVTDDTAGDGKIKVDGSEVNVYTHPSTHAATMITEDATHRFVSDTEKTQWGNAANIKDATDSTAQQMQSSYAATNIIQDSTHRFATDTEKASWNSKVGSVTKVSDGKIRVDNTDVTVIPQSKIDYWNEMVSCKDTVSDTEASEGHSSIAAANVTTDANNRFVSDADKAKWDAKADQSALNTEATARAAADTMLQTSVDNAIAKATALQNGMLIATDKSQMTNTSAYYILSKADDADNGKWFYHNGSDWVAGGQAAGVTIDNALTVAGAAADAKAVGDQLTALSSDLTNKSNQLEEKQIELSESTTEIKKVVDEWFGESKNLFDATEITTTNKTNWTLSEQTETSIKIVHNNTYTAGYPTAPLDLSIGEYVWSANIQTENNTKMRIYKDGQLFTDLVNGTVFSIVEDGDYSIIFPSNAVGTTTISDISLKSTNTKGKLEERLGAIEDDVKTLDDKLFSGNDNVFDATGFTTSNRTNWTLVTTKESIECTHNNTYTTGTPEITLNAPQGEYVFRGVFTTDGTIRPRLYADGQAGAYIEDGSIINIEDGKVYKILLASSKVGTLKIDNISLKLNGGGGVLPKIEETVKEMADIVNNIKDIKTVSKKLNTPAIISFIDDDCRSEVYTILYPLIKSLGIPYTLALPPNDIGTNTFMTKAQLDEMVNDGVSLSCHVNFFMDNVSATEMEKTIKETKRQYDEWGYTVPSYAYVNGRYSDDNVRRVVMPNFKMGFLTKGGINKVPFASYYMLRCGIISGTNFDLADAKAMVDRVALDGGWLIFMTHAWFPYFIENGATELPELVNYIRSKNVDIVDINDAIAKYGNQFETAGFKDDGMYNKPYTVVDYTGKLWSNQITQYDMVSDADNIGYQITSDGVVLLNLVNYSIINTNGTISKFTESNYGLKVSEPVSVTDCSSVYVGGYATSGRLVYAFYKADGTYLSGQEGTGILSKTLVSVPSGASTIRVAGNFNNNMPYLKKML